MNKIIICFGTRPELIKIAPIVWELKKRKLDKQVILVNTNQHIDTIDLDLFDIPFVDYNLHVFSKNQSLVKLYSKIMNEFDLLIKKLRLEGNKLSSVLIQGDTATSFNIAHSAFLNKIPVIHLEAGLRSNQISSPFPEEYNRRAISLISDLHFVPSDKEFENLKYENVEESKIKLVGNTINDTLLKFYNKNNKREELDTVLVTIHRENNQNERFDLIFNQINKISHINPSLKFIWIVHHNEKIKNKIDFLKNNSSHITFVKHLNYNEMMNIYKSCMIVITDSGGIIEETARLGIPRIIVRNDNERHGIIQLDNTFIFNPEVDNLTNTFLIALKAKREPSYVYGDTNISSKIVDSIVEKYL